MPIKQNPFSLYDFLGYFIPGAFSLTSIFTWLITQDTLSDTKFIDILVNSKQDVSFESPLFWMVLILFVITSYILGFATSLISSFIVEHYLIVRKGYPSKYRFKPVTNSLFYDCENIEFKAWIYITLALPIAVFDMTLGIFLDIQNSYYKCFKNTECSFVEPIIISILKKISNDEQIELRDCCFNWHKYIYHYIFEQGSNHSNKIQNYVAMYGFSRTISFVFVLLTWLSIFTSGFTFFTLSFSFLSYVFFCGFAKFYRRYTDEILMAAVALETIQKQRNF